MPWSHKSQYFKKLFCHPVLMWLHRECHKTDEAFGNCEMHLGLSHGGQRMGLRSGSVVQCQGQSV